MFQDLVSVATGGAPAELERELAAGRSAALLAEVRPVDPLATEATLAFVIGRAYKQEEDFVLARRFLDIAASCDDLTTSLRANAHLAHLDYYDGRFAAGLARAKSAALAARGFARAEALLYASVNAMGLNESDVALGAAVDARNLALRVRDLDSRLELRFRIARQLVHVHVARGEYTYADSEAATATNIAARIGAPRLLGFAAYLAGYARHARGDAAALSAFAEAARHWGSRYRAFGRWSQFVWACALRDQGELDAAESLRLGSGIDLPWESILFTIARGRIPDPPRVAGMSGDERPFRSAAAGLARLVAGDASGARTLLEDAVAEFARCGLEHYRRGAALNLIGAIAAQGDTRRAATRLEYETHEILRARIVRWPWWTSHIGVRLAKLAERTSFQAQWAALLSPARHAAVGTSDLLRATGLTERETQVVTQWLDHRDWSRARLAEELGISQASLRNHVNRARRKLQCGSMRGADAFAERLRTLVSTSRRGLS